MKNLLAGESESACPTWTKRRGAGAFEVLAKFRFRAYPRLIEFRKPNKTRSRHFVPIIFLALAA
jgi:hypothetical protein